LKTGVELSGSTLMFHELIMHLYEALINAFSNPFNLLLVA